MSPVEQPSARGIGVGGRVLPLNKHDGGLNARPDRAKRLVRVQQQVILFQVVELDPYRCTSP